MFIKSFSVISPQLTFTDEFRNGNMQVYTEGMMHAVEPSYLNFIPAGMLRRMGKAVRMGIGAGLPLIKEHPAIEGIIIGSANGGLEDCIKFLNQIVDFEEGVLTPTNFVNSTPNSVAGLLALMGDKMGYNSTHTNGSLSFDNVLLDAKLLFEATEKPLELLIGALEEISEYNYNIDEINGFYKESTVSNLELIQSATPGSICGEGAAMFVVSNQKEGAIARYVDQFQMTLPDEQAWNQQVMTFLSRNNVDPNDIDVLLFGNAGDVRNDYWYDQLKNTCFPTTPQYSYKHYCGDYRTSNSFAFYLALELFQGNQSIDGLSSIQNPKKILIYNQFDGKRHGLILLEAVQS